jgi:phage terminase large subunit-like protein
LTISVLDVPLGVQVPRVFVDPPRVSSEGADAAELAASVGLHLDEWQRLALDVGLGRRDDGRWSAFEVGIIVGRQNGKGSVLEARELAGLFLLDEQLILHSAHEFKTSQEAFRRILSLIENSDWLYKQVARVRTSHGEEGIELRNGNRLRFVARSTGSGRGFTGDCIVFDEAYRLPPAMMAALLPTLSARPNPQLWYTTSTPGIVDENSQQMRQTRARALGDSPGRLAWLEWSCEADTDPGDPDAWATANPALGIRIDHEFVMAEKDAMPEEAFLVERLGVWPSELDAGRVIGDEQWGALCDPDTDAVDPVAFAIDVAPDRSSSCIAVGGERSDGLSHVAVVDHKRGTRWVVERVVELVERWSPSAVVLDAGGPAGSLVAELEDAGVELTLMSAREHAQACGLFFDQVSAGQLRHRDDPRLTTAITGAVTRPMGDAWAWGRKLSTTDISPLVAVTLALWAHRSAVADKPPPVFAY